jgi:hypothetical protein
MNQLENLYIQQYYSMGLLMKEQSTFEYNSLFALIQNHAPLDISIRRSIHSHKQTS